MTFKVICRKNIVYRDSTSPLCLLFFQGKRKKSIGLGVSVAPAHWDAEAQKVTDDCPDRDNIQFQITAKIKEYEKRIQRLEIMELPVTFENLFEQNGKRVNCTVGDYLKQIIERLEALGKYASASKHRVLCSHLSRFRSLNIRFDEIDHTFLRDFELFLRKNDNASNSIATKFAIFKAAYNKAFADGIFIQKVNPFAKYKVGSLWTRTRKRAITKGDIQKLMALEIEPSHKTEYTLFAKDIFLFSYFTAGINFTDMATLRYGDIVDGRIYYSRHKTQKLLSFHLVPNALQIIQKYSKRGHAKEDYIFPILNRNVHRTPQQIFNRTHKVLAKINRELKVLGKLIGLEVPLTTYVARHTYATVLKRSGVSVALISESLGHSDLSTPQIYLESFENSYIAADRPLRLYKSVGRRPCWYRSAFLRILYAGNSADVGLECVCSTSVASIHVPQASVEAYKSADGWSSYAAQIVGYDF